jgi:DNA replication protein DnaC
MEERMEEPREVGSAIKEVMSRLRTKSEEALSSMTEEPGYKCGICRDSEWVEREFKSGYALTYCECHYRKAAQHTLEQAPPQIRKDLEGKRLMPDYHYRVFPVETFEAEIILPSKVVMKRGVNGRAQTNILKTLYQDPTAGWAFYGSTGVGKSFLMWAQAQECAYAGIEVIFRTASQYVEGMRMSQFGDDHPDGIFFAEKIKNKIHVFLDELDIVPVTDFSIRKIFELSDLCWRNIPMVSVSFASNEPQEKLSEILGAATMRRFQECTKGAIILEREE